MDIVITGNVNKDFIKTDNYIIHKILRPGYTLCIGSQCNDGRPITSSWLYKRATALGNNILHISTDGTIQKINHSIPKQIRKPLIAKDIHTKSSLMLVDKYSPKAISDIIGHKEQINKLTDWLHSWDNSLPDIRSILITGPPGIGKTSTVHVIAKAFGYKVKEYNASDTRSISTLKGIFALGMRRLVKEIIVMDEIDGLSERGGIGEIASIIKKTNVPIICIANDKPPKLRPIINVCLDIKFNRPVKSTIVNALYNITKLENINITKPELEELCEKNGNDIRCILNILDFHGGNNNSLHKDSVLRLDLFSATQKLFNNKNLTLDECSNLTFVDYNMIPMMIQEAYISSSKYSLEESVRASQYISDGDLMNRYILQKQNWTLLPHYVQSCTAAVKSVSGHAPFQIFPQWLGKNSKRLKHVRYIDNLSSKFVCSNDTFRMDYADTLNSILLHPLVNNTADIKSLIQHIKSLNITRDELFDNLGDVLFNTIEIPTKIKTAFTREYNKSINTSNKSKKIKKLSSKNRLDEDELDDIDCVDDVDDVDGVDGVDDKLDENTIYMESL